jgi:hypothetical protein
MIEKPENSDAVIECDHDKTLASQSFAIVNRYSGGALTEAASVNVNENRPFLAGGLRRRPDVKVQAVFANLVVRHELVGPRLSLLNDGLDAAGTEPVGFQHARPWSGRLRSYPPQVANGRSRKWDSFEYRDAWLGSRDTRNQPAFCLHRLLT